MKRRELHRVRAVRQPHRTGSNPPQRAAVLLRRRGTPIRFTRTVRIQEIERHTVFAGTIDRGRNLAQDKPTASNSRSLLKITTLRISPGGATPRARPLKQGSIHTRTCENTSHHADIRVEFNHAPITRTSVHTRRSQLQAQQFTTTQQHVSGQIPVTAMYLVDGADTRHRIPARPIGRHQLGKLTARTQHVNTHETSPIRLVPARWNMRASHSTGMPASKLIVCLRIANRPDTRPVG